MTMFKIIYLLEKAFPYVVELLYTLENMGEHKDVVPLLCMFIYLNVTRTIYISYTFIKIYNRHGRETYIPGKR